MATQQTVEAPPITADHDVVTVAQPHQSQTTETLSSSSSLERFIEEGKARVRCTKDTFYNPVQEFNRDMSVMTLNLFVSHHNAEVAGKFAGYFII